MTADTGADDEGDAHSDAATADENDAHSDAADGDDAHGDAAAAHGTDTEETAPDGGRAAVDPEDVAALAEAVDALGDDLATLETRIEEKTVHRDDIRAELRRYVRKRQRRGHATGWGPYLVLLYGTAMTVAAFFYLGDLAAILAMVVIWLSTLGLYIFMIVLGGFIGVGRRVLGLRDLIEKFRN